MHPNAPQFAPNKIALSTLGPAKTLEKRSLYPRLDGGRGVQTEKTAIGSVNLLPFTALAGMA
jgi:hypothetical protein